MFQLGGESPALVGTKPFGPGSSLLAGSGCGVPYARTAMKGCSSDVKLMTALCSSGMEKEFSYEFPKIFSISSRGWRRIVLERTTKLTSAVQ